MIVYISIGNSDDKLSQMEWGKFYRKVDLTLQGYRNHGLQIHGRWVSQSTDYWQNACWCIEIPGEIPSTDTIIYADTIKRELRRLAANFNQDSIAWAPAPETEFLSSPEP